MRRVCIAGLLLAAAGAAIAQTTSPERRLPPQQPPPVQVQVPVQQPPAITPRAPLAGQIPVYIQGLRDVPSPQQDGRTTHATQANRDYDRDGHDARPFGGPDCDDEDRRRHPAAAEVFDAEGLDEDCDFTTLPARDQDRDGYISWQAINVIRTSDGRAVAVLRGADCDDLRSDVHPGLVEVVGDLRDNDCDGLIDVVDRPGHREYCAPTNQVSAQAPTRPCGQAGGDTSQVNRR